MIGTRSPYCQVHVLRTLTDLYLHAHPSSDAENKSGDEGKSPNAVRCGERISESVAPCARSATWLLDCSRLNLGLGRRVWGRYIIVGRCGGSIGIVVSGLLLLWEGGEGRWRLTGRCCRHLQPNSWARGEACQELYLLFRTCSRSKLGYKKK